MEFLRINFLWNLVWILPLFFILALIASQKRRKLLTSVLGKRYSNSEFINLSHNKRTFRVWLLAGIIAFLIIAASRPYWGYKILPFSGSGKDILAVIDVSKSMLSKDIQPSRLEHAKLLLKNLIRNTPGDRYGIIAFAGSAFLECPLTIDRTSLFSILKDINIDSIPVGGTNVEKALNTAIKAFKAAAGGYKAIILITDGDELQGNSENVITKLKELKTPLLVVGIGDPTKPGLIQLPAGNGQSKFLKDSNGELVKSKLNEVQLRKLAEATNGVYIRSTAVDPGLSTLEKKIAQLIPEKYENGKMTRPLEKYQIPLFIVIILMFIWLCTGEIKRPGRVTIKVILILAFFLAIGSPFDLKADNSANVLPQQQEQTLQISKENTLPNATENQANSVNNTENLKTSLEIFNMGVTAHEKGEVDAAQKHYTNAINSAEKNKSLRSKAYQNMGVIQHAAAREAMMQNPEEALKKLEKAENLYKEAMRRDTTRQEIAANQQILLNDRKKTEEIIKRRKEMEKKKNEARQKTKEALEKQHQVNNEKQKQQDNSDQKQKNNSKQQKNSEQQQKEANRKTQEAQKAVQDYIESAKQNNSQQDMQAGQGAANDISDARKNQNNKNTDDAEKKLQEALEKLGGQSSQQQDKNQQDKSQQQDQEQQDNNQQNKQQQKKDNAEKKTEEALNQQQQANQAKGQDKKEKQDKANQKTQEAKQAMDDYKNSADQNNSPEDKQKAEKARQNIEQAQQSQNKNDGPQAEEQLKEALKNLKGNDDKNEQQKELPQQQQEQPAQPTKYDNKEIDPKQAEALLQLMANEEKSLKDELKKRKKKAYGNMSIDKDW